LTQQTENRLPPESAGNAPGRRLRILWLSHLIPYPPKGGVLMRSYHLVREVAKYHDLDLFAFNQPRLLSSYFKTSEAGLEVARTELSKFVRELHFAEIPAETTRARKRNLALRSLFTPDPYTINWLKSPEASARIEALLRAQNYDVVHFDTISLAPYFSDLVRGCTMLDHHNVESHMLLRRAQNEPNPLKKFYFRQEGQRLRRYEERHLKRFDAHIVCSTDDRQRLLEVDSSLDVTTIANGIAVDSAPPPRAPVTPHRLLFIGGLDWYPNTDAVLFLIREVWPLILQKRTDIELHIVGKNPPESIKTLAAQTRGIFIHGFVDDIRKIYSSASLFVCPIRDGGGTKLKILDAMAHAVPVLAHPIACEGIDTTDGKNVMLASTPEEFASTTLTQLDDRERLTDIGLRGFELIREQYDFANIGRALARRYSELVQRREQKARTV